jgi:glycosyltransferase involved in cell wall biosynthesis
MNQARVAIITRTKNRVLLLERALRSVLDQTFQDWTHVIVNDGGDAAEVRKAVAPYLERYRGRVTVIDNPVSVGMEAASNIGVRASASEFVVIHDDDDTWERDFLVRCVGFMDAAGKPVLGYAYGGVVTHSLRVNEEIDGQMVRRVGVEPFNTWLSNVSLYRLAAGNVFPPISFLFRRDVWEDVGGFREELPVLGDWDFHLRVCARYEIGLVPELLANYHYRSSIHAGDYGNTIFVADGKHRAYENLYRNELLRRDLEAGKAGLGFMVNVASSFEHLNYVLRPMERVRRRFRGNFLWRGLSRLFPREPS